MAKILTRCPVCEAGLHVSELTCGRCRTRIAGQFDPCRFCSLPGEHLAFLETFLRCEGNLSRVEKDLGLSYPTVRNRFTAMLAALGYGDAPATPERKAENSFAFAYTTGTPAAPAAPPTPPTPSTPEASARRLAILDALGRGEMDAVEAATALRDL
ncbi:MAG: hypothetical protein JWL77_5099 [Chthonomonadaceae bacterium]|nr:hypothetical protein [Chthonomonadaceae bacterium]